MSKVFTDMMGNEVRLNGLPRRIISLVPSQTELLYDLGLAHEVVGITKFCVHPHEWFRNKKRVGGTKTVHLDIIYDLQPDLIIANKEENTREQIETLAAQYPVWVSNIQTTEEGLDMITKVGELTGRQQQAQQLVAEVSAGFNGLQEGGKCVKVAYYIWKNPWMCAGGDTFISNIIAKMGWQNVNAHLLRYPEVTPEALAGTGVQLVLLSSEPYPFQEKHIAEIKATLPNVEVILVDGEMFSWYGSRMAKAIPYLQKLVHSYSAY